MQMLKGKTIVLGVTGSIACFKAAFLVSILKKAGADVHVIMTDSAKKFVSELTFCTISQNSVYSEMFEVPSSYDVKHISLAKKADLIVIAPATANIISKLASGIADDPLSCVVLASKAKVLVAPAMNEAMFENEIIQENISKLKKRGFEFIGPESGDLACSDKGIGRMSEPEKILEKIVSLLGVKNDLKGKKILVTAGPTREFIDPVRYISNSSSGKMGFAIAEEAEERGGEVVLISGPVNIKIPSGVQHVSVGSSDEMGRKTNEFFKQSDIVIMAAAVSDFKPKKISLKKIKKNNLFDLELEKTRDILEEMGSKKGKTFLVGFALETDDLIENAKKKIKTKNLDLIIANQVKDGFPFSSETNKVSIIQKNGKIENLPEMSKKKIAKIIFDRVVEMMK